MSSIISELEVCNVSTVTTISVLTTVQAEYCPPIDSALFSAILLDHDINVDASLAEARETLDALKASALEEESSGFDPSGSGAQDRSVTDDSESTALSEDLSNVHLGRHSPSQASDPHFLDQNLNNLDDTTKVDLLKEAFPTVSEYAIQHTLKKCEGSFDRTLDDLLNQAYFAEDGGRSDEGKISTKGVDAFSEEHSYKRGRKAKKRKKQASLTDGLEGFESFSPNALNEANPPFNKWEAGKEDIHFVVARTRLAEPTVRSAYTRCGSSLPATVAYLLKEQIETNATIASEDTTIQNHAVELGYDFPNISAKYLTALIAIMHPSTAFAHEMAKVLTSKRPATNDLSVIIPEYRTPSLSEDGYESSEIGTPRSATSATRQTEFSHNAAASMANNFQAARSTAIAQAQAAYRRSRSDRLMAGAAGYYADVGREHSAASLRYSSMAADALVDSQSTSLQIDLHGVNVQDAVRIAKQRVESWWAGLGEDRVNGRLGAEERARGFSIVTGVGRHSEGGKGKLGPAVNKMLTAQGWRVENNGGVILVRGRAKKA